LPKRILIADDHESVLRRIRAMLDLPPTWEVCGEAVNGRDAVAKSVQLRPDLVVLDFAMPQLDGLKTASEIHQVLPEVPIVMFTMYAEQVKQEMQKYGISRLVDKADSGALVISVQELLGTPDTESQKGESGHQG
jgi:DNA-binding NarL/FixJ family response regulator